MNLYKALIWFCILYVVLVSKIQILKQKRGDHKRNQQETEKVAAKLITMKLVPHHILDRGRIGMTAITCFNTGGLDYKR